MNDTPNLNPNADTRDYDIESGFGGDLGATGVCDHCGTPAYYDRTDDAFHHAVNAERGCFLIPSEQRDDDTFHPSYTAYTTYRRAAVEFQCDDYAADITANDLNTLFRLHWTDYVCQVEEEFFYSMASALTRLAALEMCRASKWEKGFAIGVEEFGARTHEFLNGTIR